MYVLRMRSSAGILARVVEDGFVHHFDRRGLVAQDHRRGGERFQQVGEHDHHHRFGLRQRHQAELRFQHDAQRAFRADHDACARLTGFAASVNSSRL